MDWLMIIHLVGVLSLGLILGSFLNVLIDRLPVGKSVLWGRSACDHCKKTLRWFELVPLLSFLIQGGSCRRCHTKLSLQYPFIELLTAIILVFLYLQFSYSLILLFSYSLILFSLFVIFFADLKYQIIPDSMLVVGIIGALLIQFSIFNFQFSNNFQASIFNALLSGVGASAFFFALWIGTKGRGMGFGDVKLALLLGIILGSPKIVVALYVAFLTGAMVGVILMIAQKKSLKTKIAFGPFLIFGTLVAVMWGEQIVSWWRGYL